MALYKYTPHPRILQRLANAERQSRPWDATWLLKQELFGAPAAYSINRIWMKYRAFEFYSPKLLREVPLDGVLLPVALFKETEV